MARLSAFSIRPRLSMLMRSMIRRCFRFRNLALLCFASALSLYARASDNVAAHTDPINLTPQVREAHLHFYNLDYDGALSRFEAIQHANPQSALATDYVLMVLIFRELYHQDLLDTTYYAHDSFLSSKRNVLVPEGDEAAN